MASSKKAPYAYSTLARTLREALLAGEFADGERLPTEAELVEEHEVSRQTVRRAMQELVSEGLIHRVPGRGTFPATRDAQLVRQFGSVEDLLSLSEDTILEVVKPITLTADVAAAGRLQLNEDIVHVIELRRMYRGVPINYMITYLPRDIADELTDVTEFGKAGAVTMPFSTIIGLIEHRTGMAIATADQSITVGSLPEQAAESMEASPGAPMLRIDRLYRDDSARPIELAVSWWNPSLYTYRVQLKRR